MIDYHCLLILRFLYELLDGYSFQANLFFCVVNLRLLFPLKTIYILVLFCGSNVQVSSRTRCLDSQWRHLPHDWWQDSLLRVSQEHPLPHVLLWHVRLLRAVRLQGNVRLLMPFTCGPYAIALVVSWVFDFSKFFLSTAKRLNKSFLHHISLQNVLSSIINHSRK